MKWIYASRYASACRCRLIKNIFLRRMIRDRSDRMNNCDFITTYSVAYIEIER